MTLDLPHLDQAPAADPWESADSWPSSWPSFAELALGVTSSGDLIGRTRHNATPRLIGHVAAAHRARRGR